MPNFVSGAADRKTHSFPCAVMLCAVDVTTICETLASRKNCDVAKLTGLVTLPTESRT